MMAKMMSCEVEIKLPRDFEAKVLHKVNNAIDDACMELAADVLAEVKNSSEFQDYTGTARESEWHKKHFPSARRLRRGYRKRKSKFENGGAIVYNSAPHSHLVEWGHVLVEGRKWMPRYGEPIGVVPPHHALTHAKQKVIGRAARVFAEKIERELGKG